MISWIQRNFQHHFKIIFGVILVVTIVSFIISYGPGSGAARGGGSVVVREFFGHQLDGANPAPADLNDAKVSIDLQLGGAGGINPDEIGNYALQRLAALHLADELHLPPPSQSEEADFIRNLRFFMGTDGQFDPVRYNLFRENLRKGGGLTEADIARVVADDVRISRLQALLDGPGYVLPSDVREQIVRSDTLWTIGTATVDYASFRPSIVPTSAQLDRFFQQNTFRYEMPPTVVANYVDFPAAPLASQVVLSDGDVRAFYEANPSRFPAPSRPAAKGAKPDPAADYAAVRPAVEAALRLERARNLAVRAASDLAYSLYDEKVAGGSALESYLAARKLALKPLAPFSRDTGPAELGGSPEIGEAAFKLSADRYFSEAMPVPSGGAVLIWRDSRPARTPLLAEVHARVEADYVENERRERFVALGRSIHDSILSRLKAGASFDKAAAAAAAGQGVKVDARILPAFTLESRPKDLNETVGGALSHLGKGQLSDMAVTADKGYLVYVVDRKVPDAAASGPRFAEVRSQLAFNAARGASGPFLTQVVESELKRSAVVLK
jgi:peptidyl-prolyl cis-trans isomerase D